MNKVGTIALLVGLLSLSGCGVSGAGSPTTGLSVLGAAPTQAPGWRIAFLGDSWTWGVGVAVRCGHPASQYVNDPTIITSCPNGQSIPDNVARDLRASAYQNLGIGGTFAADVPKVIPQIDPSMNLVIVNIGFNDESIVQDANVVDGDFPAKYSTIAQQVHERAPNALLVFLVPANAAKVPVPRTADVLARINAQVVAVDSAVEAESLTARIVNFSEMPIYDPAYYDPVGTCETSGVSDCGGSHPNDTGTSAMGHLIAKSLSNYVP